jgi:hypothetical protein
MNGYVERRLGLTRCSIAVWKVDVDYIAAARTGSANSGYVDANNLIRAGQVLAEIEAEQRVLRHLADGPVPDLDRIAELSDLLDTLRCRLLASSREMHGLTA